MALVTAILLMFLSNVRAALIVAINIPLALLFAFGVLFLRGKSANLLSIGAVDFGIIVDSSVIMVENIYRHLTAQDERRRSRCRITERVVRGGGEVDQEPVLLDHHHGLRAAAAVHDEGAGRADLRADGRHLRLRPRRGAAAGADRLAGALPAVSSKQLEAGAGQLPGPRLARRLTCWQLMVAAASSAGCVLVGFIAVLVVTPA